MKSNKQRRFLELLKKGADYYSKKEYDKAIKCFTQAIELDKSFLPKDRVSKEVLAEAYYNRGRAKYYLKDYKGAIADHNKAIELKPDYAKAYYKRGNVKRKLKDYQGAIADFDKAIELDRDYAKAYHMKGVVKYNLKDYEEAIKDFEEALKLQPDNLFFRGNLRIVKDALKSKETRELIEKQAEEQKNRLEESSKKLEKQVEEQKNRLEKFLEKLKDIFRGEAFEERERDLKEEYKNNNKWIKWIFSTMFLIGIVYTVVIVIYAFDTSNPLEWLDILRNISIMFFLTSPLVYFSRVLIHNKNRLEVLIEDCFNKRVLFKNTLIKVDDIDLHKEFLKQTYAALLEQSTTKLMVRLINKKKPKEDETIAQLFKEIEALKKMIQDKNKIVT